MIIELLSGVVIPLGTIAVFHTVITNKEREGSRRLLIEEMAKDIIDGRAVWKKHSQMGMTFTKDEIDMVFIPFSKYTNDFTIAVFHNQKSIFTEHHFKETQVPMQKHHTAEAHRAFSSNEFYNIIVNELNAQNKMTEFDVYVKERLEVFVAPKRKRMEHLINQIDTMSIHELLGGRLIKLRDLEAPNICVMQYLKASHHVDVSPFSNMHWVDTYLLSKIALNRIEEYINGKSKVTIKRRKEKEINTQKENIEKEWESELRNIYTLLNELKKQKQYLTDEQYHRIEETYLRDMKELLSMYKELANESKNEMKTEIKETLRQVQSELTIIKQEVEIKKKKHIQTKMKVIKSRV